MLANRTLLVLAFLLTSTTTACSSRRSQTSLRSTAAEIVSVASEGQLFLKFVSDGHATSAYSAAHPEYLNKQSASIVEELDKAEPGPDVDPSRLQQLRMLAARLAQATTTLQREPTNNALHDEFEEIAGETRRMGLAP